MSGIGLKERLYSMAVPEPNSGCLLWCASTNTPGYGQMMVGGKNKMAHRLAWEAENGPIPAGMFICHKCDVRSCINVDHMFLGSNSDNVADMCAKKRHPYGVRNGQAKIAPADVELIRADERLARVIAEDFNISETQVRRIRSGKSWSVVGGMS